MKKVLAFVLSVMMMLSLLAGCSKAETPKEEAPEATEEVTENGVDAEGVHVEGLPVVDEPWTLHVCMEKQQQDLGTNINEDKWAAKTAIERTNVQLEWNELASGTASEQIPIMLAGGDLPDVFFRLLNASQILQYEEEFYPIEGLFDSYAKHIYEAMSQVDGWEKMAYTPSGHVYSGFGGQQSLRDNTMNGIQVINTRWLNNVGISEIPTDWDSYYTALEAFRDQDANGNGDVSDEIPYAWANNQWCAELFDNESGRFGIPTYSRSHGEGGYVYVDANGKVQKSRSGETYKEYLTVMHEMMSTGLIDQEGFNDSWDSLSGKAKNDKIGTYCCWTPLEFLSEEQAQSWDTLPRFAYTGHENEFYQNGIKDGTTALQTIWVVTNSCEKPNAAVRFWDYLQEDEELNIAMNAGEKGLMWDSDEQGNYFQIPESTESMSYENMKYTYGFVTNCPMITMDRMPRDTKDGEPSLRVAMVNTVYDHALPESQRIMPSYVPAEATQELALYSQNLISTIEQFHGKAILNGFTDEEYDAYEKQLTDLRYDDYVAHYQRVYDHDWE